MPVVTLKPPKRSSPITSALRFAWSAATGDFLGAIQAARDLRARGEETIEYLLSPVVIDTDAGTVRIPVNALQLRADNGQEFAPKLRGLNVAKLAREAQPKLQRTWDTGNVEPGIHWAYANAAPIIAALRNETDGGPEVESPPEPQAEPTTFMNLGSIRRLDPMATIPPGGMAAFSQQTIANKLALTKGMKRSGGKRRKKKAVGASGRKRKRAKSNRKKAGKLKFGSPAWQRKYNKRYKKARGRK